MALEHVFARTRLIARLRSGHLGELVDGYCGWLEARGFRRETSRKHLSRLLHLDEYLIERGASGEFMPSQELFDEFLVAYPHRCRNRGPSEDHVKRMISSIHRFVEYLHGRGLMPLASNDDPYALLLDDYLSWMREAQCSSPETLKLRRYSLRQFLDWLGDDATITGLARLNATRLEEFFLGYAMGRGRSTRRSMQAALRTFLRFCFFRRYIDHPLDGAVPTLRTYKLATVPRGLTDAQAQMVLEGIDVTTRVGVRDYAILLILYTYGVRGGQVRSMRLEDIRWSSDQLFFPASKQGKNILLPMTEDVGRSLLAYLRHSRPSAPHPQVFLTCRAPFKPMLHSSTLSVMVERYIRAAGIDIQSKGAHAFRHCFATRMLREGSSLKEIADMLGHRYLQTTNIYTKVDFNALEQVGLPWPGEVQP